MNDDSQPKPQPKAHSDTYLFLLSDTRFHLAVVGLWNIAWLAYCATTHEWQWFMRSGKEERIRFRNMNVIEIFTESEKANQENDSVAVIYGAWIMIYGTAVAAYGDLIGRF